jgi:predicted glutamine amidotransferase
MCRLFGIYGKVEIWKNLLQEFQKQAETGKIPPIANLQPGHKDGWGLACSVESKEGMQLIGKHIGSAYNSPEYSQYLDELIYEPYVLLCHLRKASPGIEISLGNAQPFITNNWAFIHNGTVYNPETLKYSEQYIFSSDNSDSEYYFHYLLTKLEKKGSNQSPANTLVDSVANIKVDFSSLNCMLTDGNSFYSVRYCSKHHSYYTLFYYQDDSGVVFSSEPIETDLLSKENWIEVENRSVVEILKEPITVNIYAF